MEAAVSCARIAASECKEAVFAPLAGGTGGCAQAAHLLTVWRDGLTGWRSPA
jgi:hypothetical protein